MNLDKMHVQRQFDRSAVSYDTVAGMQREIAAELITHLAQSNEPAARILDAGCGTGYGLQFLEKEFPQAHLTGVDLAPAMLGIAHEHLPDATFVQGDIESLPFDDGQFDIAWSSSAVQWCDLPKAVSELVRVTKPGGHILLSTFSEGTLQQWRQIWGVEEGDRFLPVQKIRDAFQLPGLTPMVVAEKRYDQVFNSFSEAVQSIRELGAGNAGQDRAQGLLGLGRYRAIKTKFDQIIEQRGVISLPYNVVFVSAVKARE